MKLARLDASVALDGDGLKVAFTLENLSGRTMFVADSVIASRGSTFAPVPGRLIVMNAAAPGERKPGEIQLVLGSVPSNRPSFTLYPPLFIAVAAGASVSRELTLPLPLQPWHPLGGVDPLDGEPRTALVKVEYFALDVDWIELPSADATTKIVVPRNARTQLAIAGPLELPRRTEV
jgi:hypothetical protein